MGVRYFACVPEGAPCVPGGIESCLPHFALQIHPNTSHNFFAGRHVPLWEERIVAQLLAVNLRKESYGTIDMEK